MKYILILILGITCKIYATTNVFVEWCNEPSLTLEERKDVDEKAIYYYKLLSGVTNIVYPIRALYQPEEGEPETPKGKRMLYLYKFTKESRSPEIRIWGNSDNELFSYSNYALMEKADEIYYKKEKAYIAKERAKPENKGKNIPILVEEIMTKEQAAKKATNILDKLKIDKSTIKLRRCSFFDGTWDLDYELRIGKYTTPCYRVGITCADNQNLDLLDFYRNYKSIPKVEIEEPKISGKMARVLADKALVNHYYKHELKTLVYSSTKIFYIKPDYRLLPGYDFENPKYGSLTLAWEVWYNRNNKTYVRSPVQVYIDAITGECLGITD